MRTMLTLLGSIVLVLAMGPALAVADEGHAGNAQEKTVQGELIDTQCFTAGGAKGEGHADCAEKCLASGIPAGVLMSDGAVMVLTTNPAPLAEHAGKQMRVTGRVNPDAKTLAPDKVEVETSDGEWTEVKMKDAHREG